MQTDYDKAGFQIALLSLSLLTIMSGAGIAPGIHNIAEAFPYTSQTIVKLIISIPPLIMIGASLLSGLLGQYIRHRVLIVSGLILFVVTGVGAGYMQTIPQILLFRVILGVGTGIILPYSTGLIAACFDGQKRIKMMGYSTATNSFGIILSNSLAGILAAMSWRYAFHIYWLGGLVLVLVLAFLKDFPQTLNQRINEKLPGSVFLYGFFALLIMMVLFLIVTNLPFIVAQKELGSAKTTGYLFALNSFMMLIGSVSLPKLLKLKKYFLPLVMVVSSCGFFGIAKSESLAGMIFAVVVAGVGLGAWFPYFLNCITLHVSKSLSVKAMSVGMACAWFGQFLSPLFFGGMASVGDFDILQVFQLVSAIILIMAIIVFSINRFQKVI